MDPCRALRSGARACRSGVRALTTADCGEPPGCSPLYPPICCPTNADGTINLDYDPDHPSCAEDGTRPPQPGCCSPSMNPRCTIAQGATSFYVIGGIVRSTLRVMSGPAQSGPVTPADCEAAATLHTDSVSNPGIASGALALAPGSCSAFLEVDARPGSSIYGNAGQCVATSAEHPRVVVRASQTSMDLVNGPGVGFPCAAYAAGGSAEVYWRNEGVLVENVNVRAGGGVLVAETLEETFLVSEPCPRYALLDVTRRRCGAETGFPFASPRSGVGVWTAWGACGPVAHCGDRAGPAGARLVRRRNGEIVSETVLTPRRAARLVRGYAPILAEIILAPRRDDCGGCRGDGGL